MLELLKQLLLSQQQRNRAMAAHLEQEEIAAATLLYNHLLGRSSDQLSGFWRYQHYNAEFSGDLVLARRTPDDRILLLLADATGHGLSATLTLLPLATLFREGVDLGLPLPGIVQNINRELHQQLPADRFVAALLIEVDLRAGLLRVWNGGMPSLLLLDAAGRVCHRFESRHLALGILPVVAPELVVLPLPARGWLFGYSDGLVEQTNASGQRLPHEVWLAHLSAPGPQVFQRLIEALQDFAGVSRFDDDISMLLVQLDQMQS